MTEPTLETARNVAEATLAHASHLGIKVSVCVVDSRGHELVTLPAGGANWFTAEVARAKARTAAALRRDSGALDGLKGSYPELFRLIGGQLSRSSPPPCPAAWSTRAKRLGRWGSAARRRSRTSHHQGRGLSAA